MEKYTAGFIVNKESGSRDEWFVVIRNAGNRIIKQYPVGATKPKNAYIPHFLNKFMEEELGAVV